MQAEDIIQAKEWQQLTEAERKAVEPLASTEGEYNVLKKMLMIAQEDAEDVPAINPAVQQNLYAHLEKPSKKVKTMVWYAAAASIILIALVTFFFVPKKQIEIAVKPNDKPSNQNAVDTTNKKPSLIIPAPIDDSTEMVKQEQPKSISKEPNSRKDSVVNLREVAHINTSVSDNTELLAFVTEVY